jgi:hypothetical protein
MKESSLIYCDESGNDGPNYLNDQAPFYVLAGWVVPENAIGDAEGEMESLRTTHCREAPELKFKMFRGKPWVVSESMSRLGQIGLIPIYLIAEKRYCIAGKIVETFLDPYYNPALRKQFSYNLITKQELANTLYEKLSDETLRRFAEAYRAPTHADLELALDEVSKACRRCVNAEIAELLEGSRANLAEIAEAEINAVNTWGKGMGTLNLPCLVSFLMLVEELGRQQNIRPKKIIHDEQGPYQKDYHRAFEQYKKTDWDERILINGMRVPFGAIRTIDDFEIQRSVDQPLLQAADLLAGSIAHLSAALIQERNLYPQEVALGGLIFPALLLDGITLAMPVCSDRMLEKIGSAIQQAYPKINSTTSNENEIDDRCPFRWTSTAEGEGPLPVLPVPMTSTTGDHVPDRIIKIDLPLFGIANDSVGQLAVLLPHGKAFDQTNNYERCVPLWTSRGLADTFLEELEWSEPHHVIEFGPKELPNLVSRLREQAHWVELVWFNLFEEKATPYPIKRLADEMERIWNRCLRVAEAGIIDLLFKQHETNGDSIVSLLLSSGQYAAMRISDGLMSTGDSREEALSNLAKAMTTRGTV